jgi:hypothetical protein
VTEIAWSKASHDANPDMLPWSETITDVPAGDAETHIRRVLVEEYWGCDAVTFKFERITKKQVQQRYVDILRGLVPNLHKLGLVASEGATDQSHATRRLDPG